MVTFSAEAESISSLGERNPGSLGQCGASRPTPCGSVRVRRVQARW